MDKKASDIVSRHTTQSGYLPVTDMSYLFSAVCCLIFDILSSKVFNYGAIRITPVGGHLDRIMRDIAMRDVTSDNAMNMTENWRKEGCTHLHIDDVSQLPFVRAIAPLRTGAEIPSFLETREHASWQRRTSMVKFTHLRFWITFGMALGNLETIERDINDVAEEIVRNPAVLLQSSIAVPREYGVLQQLNAPFARSIAWVFGPTNALQPTIPRVIAEHRYIAASCFFGDGISALCTGLPPTSRCAAGRCSTCRQRPEQPTVETL